MSMKKCYRKFVALISLFVFLVILSAEAFAVEYNDCNFKAMKEQKWMPNPSAIYCEKLGYKYVKVKTEKGEEGFCLFPDGSKCSAWDFYAGKCGEKFSYCSKLGGVLRIKNDGKDPFSREYSTCMLPDKREVKVGEFLELKVRGFKSKSYKYKHKEKAFYSLKEQVELPSYFDWRNKDGEDWLTPVKDQGPCGSCWAFSAIGAVEAQYNIFTNNASFDPDLSEQYLVSCSGAGSCEGGYISKALDFIKRNGTVDEECMPYNASDVPCDYKCEDWENRLWKINESGYVVNNPENIKKWLINDGPLSVAMGIGSDCGGYWDGDIYRCTDDSGINHAVVIVGYNDSGKYWIVRNSWGTDWPPGDLNDNGYFKVGYGECAIENYASYAMLYGNGKYCFASSANSDYEWIVRVRVNNGEKISGSSTYSNFTNETLTALRGGETYNIEVEVHTEDFFTEYVKAWIDFDKDYVFEENEEIDLGEATFKGNHNFTASFTIPKNTSHDTLMRVYLSDDPPTPCMNAYYGEVEDYRITIDSESPSVTVNSPTNTTYNCTDIPINVTVTDNNNVDTVIAELDGNTNYTLVKQGSTDYYVNQTMIIFSEEIHVLRIYANDSAGNLNSSETVTFAIDLTPPEIILNNPANNSNISSKNINFTFTITDNLDNSIDYELYIDGDLNQNGIANNNTMKTVQVNGLSDGMHTWYVVAEDNVNNINQSEVRNFRVDITYLNLAGEHIGITWFDNDLNQDDSVDYYDYFVSVYDSTGLIQSFELDDVDISIYNGNLIAIGDGVYYDSNNDGDVKDAEDYVLYNSMYVVDAEKGIIRMAYALNNRTYSCWGNGDSRIDIGEVYKVRGGKYLITDFNTPAQQFKIMPAITKVLTNLSVNVDNAVIIEDNRKVLYNNDGVSAKLYFYEGDSLLETIDITGSIGFENRENLTDDFTSDTFKEYKAWAWLSDDETLCYLVMGKKADEITVSNGYEDIFDYALVKVADPDFPDISGHDDQIIFLDSPITLVENYTYISPHSVAFYNEGLVDIKRAPSAIFFDGSRIKCTCKPGSNFLATDVWMSISDDAIRTTYYKQDLNDDGNCTNDVWLDYNGSTLDALKYCQNGECYRGLDIIQYENDYTYDFVYINNGLLFDATGDGDLKDADDYVIYDGMWIIDGSDGTIKFGYVIDKHWKNDYANNSGYLAGNAFKLKGKTYAINSVSDLTSGEIEIGSAITKKILDAVEVNPDNAVVINGSWKVLYDFNASGDNRGVIYFYEGNSLLDVYSFDTTTFSGPKKLNDDISVGDFEDQYNIFLVKVNNIEQWISMVFVDKYTVVEIVDEEEDIMGYDSAWVNNSDWQGHVVFWSEIIDLEPDTSMDIPGTYYTIKFTVDKYMDIKRKHVVNCPINTILKPVEAAYTDFLSDDIVISKVPWSYQWTAENKSDINLHSRSVFNLSVANFTGLEFNLYDFNNVTSNETPLLEEASLDYNATGDFYFTWDSRIPYVANDSQTSQVTVLTDFAYYPYEIYFVNASCRNSTGDWKDCWLIFNESKLTDILDKNEISIMDEMLPNGMVNVMLFKTGTKTWETTGQFKLDNGLDSVELVFLPAEPTDYYFEFVLRDSNCNGNETSERFLLTVTDSSPLIESFTTNATVINQSQTLNAKAKVYDWNPKEVRFYLIDENNIISSNQAHFYGLKDNISEGGLYRYSVMLKPYYYKLEQNEIKELVRVNQKKSWYINKSDIFYVPGYFKANESSNWRPMLAWFNVTTGELVGLTYNYTNYSALIESGVSKFKAIVYGENYNDYNTSEFILYEIRNASNPKLRRYTLPVGEYELRVVAIDSAENKYGKSKEFSVIAEITNTTTIEENVTESPVITTEDLEIIVDKGTGVNATITIQTTIAPDEEALNLTDLNQTTAYGVSNVQSINVAKVIAINSTLTNVTNVTLKMYYNLSKLGLSASQEDYNHISIFWYNESGKNWVRLTKGLNLSSCNGPYVYDVGINTTGKYVYAILDHFSVYGLAGMVYQPSPGGVSTGGGGGGAIEVFTKAFQELTSSLLQKVFKAKGLLYKTFIEVPRQALASLLSIAEQTYKYPYFSELQGIIKKQPQKIEGDVYEITSEEVLKEYAWAPKLIIARGDLEVDSYSALAFAKANGIPILLTKPEELPGVTKEALEKLSPREIIIIGGEKAVSKQVEEELKKLAKERVTRIWGETRIETSVELAKQIRDPKYIVIADWNSDEKAAYIAYLYKAPLIYVKGEEVPEAVEEYLKSFEYPPKPKVIFVDVNEKAEERIESLL